MTERLIPRREVLAFIALHCTESTAPSTVEFREYVHEGEDWHTINLTVDDEAAVRFWAGVFGHGDRTIRGVSLDSGFTMYRSQADGWRGFITVVEATVEPVPVSPLDAETTAQLREIAGEVDS